jgi:hypothetical protein
MKKAIILIFLLFFAAAQLATAVANDLAIANVYRLNPDTFVPVFSASGTNFEYESGPRGSSCHMLSTVLLPQTYVRVEEKYDDGTLKIVATRDNAYFINGYVHGKFLKDCAVDCGKIEFSSLKEIRSKVPSVEKIVSNIRELLSLNVRYCYGGSSPREVALDGLYNFYPSGNSYGLPGGYKCYGFDSLGLVHYVSEGWLPHNTKNLSQFGTILFTIDTKSQLDSDFVAEILESLSDTDLVLFTSENGSGKLEHDGHVIMAYKLGFVECYGRFTGIVRTPPNEAPLRLIQMYIRAKALGAQLFIIRWHPNLLSKME